jgi:hypothetical protein
MSRKKAFNPWPLGIVVTFALFLAGSAALVVIACSGRAELVAPDYYEREIRHQERMEQMARARAFDDEIRANYHAAGARLEILLPAALYRPSAAGEDRQIELRLDDDGRQEVDAAGMSSGRWKAQMSWLVNGETFYAERDFVIRSLAAGRGGE